MAQLLAARANALRVERVSQSAVGLLVTEPPAAFARVRSRLLAWLALKVGTALPDAMLQGETATLEALGAHRVETVALDGVPYWAARQEFREAEAWQRTWVTEINLGADGSRVLRLGYRLQCLTQGERAPQRPWVPRFMRELARDYPMLLDEVEVDLQAARPETAEEVAALAALICDPGRRLAVVGVADPANPEQPPPIDPDGLAREIIGSGYVFALSRDAGFLLTDAIGKRFSVYNGAVRIWYPGVQPERSDPYDHTLFLGTRVAEEAARLRELIVEQVFRTALARREADELIPPFSAARQAAVQLARADAAAQGRSQGEVAALLEQDNRRLLAELAEARAEHRDLLALADAELLSLRRERDEALAEAERLQALLLTRDAQPEPMAEAERAVPDTFDELKEWGERHLGDVVVLLPRCIRAAKKSVFAQPQLAYRALLLLRDAYVPMRREGGESLRAAWASGLARLGLELSPTHAGARAGENPDDYFVQYDGRRWELDQHLKGSNSRDPRFGFRLYFFWHAGERCVVVGSLPAHLSTRVT